MTGRLGLIAAVIALLGASPGAAAPARVALIVDNSASTSAAIAQIRTAIAAFLDALPPEHDVVLVTTGRHTQVRVPPSLDRARLKSSAAGLLSEAAPTALMDTLTDVDGRFMRKAADRRAVFVIVSGDGSENSKNVDERDFNQWVSDVVRRGVVVDAVVLKAATNGLPDLIARTLTQATRGQYVSMSTGAGLAETLTKLAAQIADAADKGSPK